VFHDSRNLIFSHEFQKHEIYFSVVIRSSGKAAADVCCFYSNHFLHLPFIFITHNPSLDATIGISDCLLLPHFSDFFKIRGFDYIYGSYSILPYIGQV